MNTITIEKHHCVKCGHTWLPRSEKRPLSCPSCKNRKWHKDDETRPYNRSK